MTLRYVLCSAIVGIATVSAASADIIELTGEGGPLDDNDLTRFELHIKPIGTLVRLLGVRLDIEHCFVGELEIDWFNEDPGGVPIFECLTDLDIQRIHLVIVTT